MPACLRDPDPRGGSMRFRWTAVFAAGAIAFATFGMPATAGPSSLKTSLSYVGKRYGATGGEPSIAQGPGGILYTSWPNSDRVAMARSTDHGRTWVLAKEPPNVSSVGDTTVFTDHSGAVYQTNGNNVEPTPETVRVEVEKSFN